MAEVTIYGTAWCVASWDVRRLLDTIGVSYRFVDLDQVADAHAWAADLGNGRALPDLPIVRLADESIVIGATRGDIARYYRVRLDTGMLRPLLLARDADDSSDVRS